MTDVREKAEALIYSVRAALQDGVQHFDVSGKELRTVEDVLTALRRDGEIRISKKGTVTP